MWTAAALSLDATLNFTLDLTPIRWLNIHDEQRFQRRGPCCVPAGVKI
jgi:hypothetical protein